MNRFAVLGVLMLAACSSEPPPQAVMVPAPTPTTSSEPAPPPPAPPPSASVAAVVSTEEATLMRGDNSPSAAPSASSSATPFGSGRGRVASPSLRQGAVTVNGKLPPEVIQRIVRQNFGRFRLCYENGLRTNAKLSGRVAVKLTIDRSGSVVSPSDAGSDLPDKAVISCIVKGFSNLSFPQPESGTVNVTYPIIFSPGTP